MSGSNQDDSLGLNKGKKGGDGRERSRSPAARSTAQPAVLPSAAGGAEEEPRDTQELSNVEEEIKKLDEMEQDLSDREPGAAGSAGVEMASAEDEAFKAEMVKAAESTLAVHGGGAAAAAASTPGDALELVTAETGCDITRRLITVRYAPVGSWVQKTFNVKPGTKVGDLEWALRHAYGAHHTTFQMHDAHTMHHLPWTADVTETYAAYTVTPTLTLQPTLR